MMAVIDDVDDDDNDDDNDGNTDDSADNTFMEGRTNVFTRAVFECGIHGSGPTPDSSVSSVPMALSLETPMLIFSRLESGALDYVRNVRIMKEPVCANMREKCAK
jgi:hypothetical protein